MFNKVKEQYMKDVSEHAMMCKSDPYYAHCYGGGKVPAPCCGYCEYFDDGVGHPGYCMREVNNNDITNVLYTEPFEREYSDLCEHYEWNGEWEDE